jgi:hypothetical protein
LAIGYQLPFKSLKSKTPVSWLQNQAQITGRINISACSKSQVFSTEAYASEVRFFKMLELNEDRD